MEQLKVEPALGEGIYTKRDVADILRLPYQKVSRWMEDYWADYSYSIAGTKFVNFNTLIEFYTFFHMRDHGFSSQFIKKIHEIMSEELDTNYPFARKVFLDKKNVYYEKFDNLIKVDRKKQFDLKPMLLDFLNKIEFNEFDVADRYFPLDNSKRIVVDPKLQLGQPTIAGTGIKAEIINEFVKSGETKEYICKIFSLQMDQVEDALRYFSKSA